MKSQGKTAPSRQLELGFCQRYTSFAPLKQDFAVLLGAGFSKWAAGLPTAAELFDYSIDRSYQRDAARLARVIAAKQRWDEKHPQELAEQFIAHCLAEGGRTADDVIRYVARRITEPFVGHSLYRRGRYTQAITDRHAPTPGGHFLRSVSWCAGIVTTNYDLLVEYALGPRGFNYGTVGECLHGYSLMRHAAPCRLTGRLPLAKLHGSLSWDRERRNFDARCGITGRALIVAPAPEKGMPSELADTWALARNILSSTTNIIVFGFGFNQYDTAVLDLLAGSVMRRVLLIDVTHPIDRCRGVWPMAQLTCCLPPPAGRLALNEWLQSLPK